MNALRALGRRARLSSSERRSAPAAACGGATFCGAEVRSSPSASALLGGAVAALAAPSTRARDRSRLPSRARARQPAGSSDERRPPRSEAGLRRGRRPGPRRWGGDRLHPRTQVVRRRAGRAALQLRHDLSGRHRSVILSSSRLSARLRPRRDRRRADPEHAVPRARRPAPAPPAGPSPRARRRSACRARASSAGDRPRRTPRRVASGTAAIASRGGDAAASARNQSSAGGPGDPSSQALALPRPASNRPEIRSAFSNVARPDPPPSRGRAQVEEVAEHVVEVLFRRLREGHGRGEPWSSRASSAPTALCTPRAHPFVTTCAAAVDASRFPLTGHCLPRAGYYRTEAPDSSMSPSACPPRQQA